MLILRVVVTVFIVCDNVFGVPIDTNKEELVFTKRLINVLRKSGSRIAAEAKVLTNDLKNVVDVLGGGFIAKYEQNMELKANNRTKVVSTTPKSEVTTVIATSISTTTEEESNVILERTEADQQPSTTLLEETATLQAESLPLTEILGETEGTDLELTTLAFLETTMETENQKQHHSSAFNSLLLQKIQDVAKAMKEGGAALEFSTKWTTNEEGFKRKKRHAGMTTMTNDIEPITDTALHQMQQDEMNQCISRWDLEQHKFSEKKHLDGLQRELEKMEELIEILRQQQRILDSMSDIDEKYYEFLNHSMRAGNIAEQQRLVQLLEILNSKLSLNSTNATDVEEMTHLKADVEQLKLAVDDLPNHLQTLEKKFSKEIENQKKEIFVIKKSLWQLSKADKVAVNSTATRKSKNQKPLDPQNIQKQIQAIQSNVERFIARESQEEPILKEDQPNLNTIELSDLNEEVEFLQQLVDDSLNQQQTPEAASELENEENQLLGVKKVIDGLIKSKQERKQNDFVLGEPLHQLNGPRFVHIVTVPKIQKPKGAKVDNVKRSNEKSQPRSRDGDDIIKFLKEMSSANDSSSPVDPQQAELQRNIIQLQRTLQAMMDKDKDAKERDQRKQIEILADRIKSLGNDDLNDFQSRSLTDDEEEKIILKLLKRILQQLETSGRELDDGDTESELRKLADSINRLRPKDDDLAFDTEGKNAMQALQFELLSKILAQKPASTSAPFTQQQMDFLINKLTPQYQAPTFSNTPFVAPFPPTRYVDLQPNFTPQQYPAATANNNLFREYPKNFAPQQGSYTGAGQQQLDTNPEQSYINAGAYTKQKIEDLKQQIYNLQNAIAMLDSPSYVKKPGDEEMIYKLEQQIADLKSIVSALNQYPDESGSYPVKPDGAYDKPRVRRSVDVASDDDEEANRFMEQTANFLRNFMPKEETLPELQQRSSRSYENLHQKLLDLEKQLGERRKSLESNKHKSPENYRIGNTYDISPSLEISSKLQGVAKVKRLDVFEKIITKIVDVVVDKVVIAIPIVIRKLFGITVDNLADYSPSNSYSSVQSLKDLGILGYLPLIALKFLNGFTYFINTLKKNKFMKSFLMPVLVVGGVLGLLVFLIWWMQPDDYNRNGYLNYEGDKYYGKQDYNMYGYNTEYNYDNSRTALNRIEKHNDIL